MTIKKLVLLLVFTVMYSQDDLKINSDIYFDYFYSSNQNASVDNVDGFSVRRVYLTFNKSLNERFSARVRFEAGGTYFENPSDKHYPFLKDMYLKYKMNDQASFVFGLQGNILLQSYEKFYGLRYIEKSPNDLYKYQSSRDMGIGFFYKISDQLSYSFLLGNGEGDKSEFNKGDLLASTITYKSNGLVAEIGGFLNSEVKDTTNVYVLQALLGYETDDFQVMFSGHINESEDKATENITQLKALSLFASFKMNDSKLFARVDQNYFGVNTSSISNYKFIKNQEFTYFIAGYEMRPEKFMYVTPNISMISYDDSSLDSDLIYRMTLRLKW